MKKIEWTKQQCEELALKYDRRIRFKTNHSSAYRHAYLNGFLDEICSHMTFKKMDRLMNKEYPHQYNSAVTKGLLDQLFVNHKNKGLVKI